VSRSLKMSAEVARLTPRLGTILGCSTCGMGLAIDIVGNRWGEPSHDWLGGSFGHACAVTRAGKVETGKMAEVDAVVATLPGWTEPPGEPEPAPAGYTDSRMPVERDEEAEGLL
jgi:hypothetical protein